MWLSIFYVGGLYSIDLYDGMINSSITKGKIIFWDIDGVLASYRFNNHVGVDDGTHNGMSLDVEIFPVRRT